MYLEDKEDTDNDTSTVTNEPSEVDILTKKLNGLQNEIGQLKQKIEKN